MLHINYSHSLTNNKLCNFNIINQVHSYGKYSINYSSIRTYIIVSNYHHIKSLQKYHHNTYDSSETRANAFGTKVVILSGITASTPDR